MNDVTKLAVMVVVLCTAIIGVLFTPSSEKAKPVVATPKTPNPDASCFSQNNIAESRFSYFFDISGSYHNEKKRSPFKKAIEQLPVALNALRNFFPAPQMHSIGVIKGSSLDQEFLCKIYVPEPTMFKAQCPPTLIEDSVKKCQSFMREQKPEKRTDIRGALYYGGIATPQAGKGPRGLILFTDLKEDLGKDGGQPAQPKLTGFCIAVYYDITENDPKRPKLLDARIKQWNKDIRQMGAKDVLIRHVEALNADELRDFFYGCI